MSATMALGSFVAGATSQGGGAVAFPAMTLAFGVEPKPARDFALMIQSAGMSSAAIAIWVHRIPVERRALIFGSIGGALGVWVGLAWLQHFFAADPTKIFFVSLWLAFGVALLLINRNTRQARLEHLGDVCRLRTNLWLFLAGVAGGMLSGLLGSGLDILVFAVLVLGFRVCEKVATPTSVILMAGNSLIGFLLRLAGVGGEIQQSTWEFWWVCVPIVVLGAPCGAKFIAKRGRKFLIGLLLVVIALQFVAAILLIPIDQALALLAIGTFVGGAALFWAVDRYGKDSKQ